MADVSKSAVVIKRYSPVLKHKIVQEIESGTLSVREAMRMYDIKHRRTIDKWVRDLGNSRGPIQLVRVMMKSEKERIDDLEKALADAKLKEMLQEKMLELYAKEVPDLKKRLSTKQLKQFEDAERKKVALRLLASAD